MLDKQFGIVVLVPTTRALILIPNKFIQDGTSVVHVKAT